MMDFLGGRFGPLFAGARPRGSELREEVFPRLIPANRLAASLPRDFEGDDFVFLGALRRLDCAVELGVLARRVRERLDLRDFERGLGSRLGDAVDVDTFTGSAGAGSAVFSVLAEDAELLEELTVTALA